MFSATHAATGQYTYVKVNSDKTTTDIGPASSTYANSLIAYKDGYLVAYNRGVKYRNASGEESDWFTVEKSSMWQVYKNAQGKIYVCAGDLRKIWELQ